MARRPRPDPAFLTARPIAHRGFHDRAAGVPENTLAAFAAAIARSFAIECDVRLTADRQVVVFHDETLLRLASAPQSVADVSLGEMQRLRLAGTDQRPPSLAETLALVAGRTPLLIELKPVGWPDALAAAVRSEINAYRGPLAVMAFEPRAVAWFRRHAPGVVRGQLAEAYGGPDGLSAAARFARRHLLTLAAGRPHFVAHEIGCLGLPAARLWRRLGGPLLAWTARTPADYAAARKLADGLIFEGFDPTAPSPPRGGEAGS